MIYQSFKYFFVRLGVSFFLLMTAGYAVLFFVHEIALSGMAFNDAWELFQIGPDNDEGKIPIVFRQRAAPAPPDALTRDVAAN